jgi:putative endonuclease
VTADLSARITAHKAGRGSVFCRKWGLTRLVYLEHHDEIEAAIARERQLKGWKRVWKTRLISEANPQWYDLYESING